MNKINIAEKLVKKRREKAITQKELALYIGVSKASVSKWETGQSYPDITILPELATYFNISIDELIGYSPQMSKEDIRKLYHRISSSFARDPFEDVLLESRRIIKKYYSCFPLLLQMAILLANHHMLADEKREQEIILNEAIDLCIRIRKESDDALLSKEATSFQGVCYLMLQQPEDTLDLLGESIRPISTDYEILGQAYQMMGNIGKAKEVAQVSIYQHLIALIGSSPTYLMLNREDNKKVEEILHRSLALAKVYDLDKLHPNTMAQIYFSAAQVYSFQNNSEKALNMLEKYTEICTMDFSYFSLHGDSFFDEIHKWFADFDLGAQTPRNEKVVKEDMLKIVLSNPAFSFLKENSRYKKIIKRLKTNSGGQ